jgi:hypothetical protein
VGNCKDCNHWRRGTRYVYIEGATHRDGTPHQDAGTNVWKPVSDEFRDATEMGYCDLISGEKPGAELAAAIGGDSDYYAHNFYTMPDFGCVLFEQMNSRADQEEIDLYDIIVDREKYLDSIKSAYARATVHIPDPALDGLFYNQISGLWEPKKP